MSQPRHSWVDISWHDRRADPLRLEPRDDQTAPPPRAGLFRWLACIALVGVFGAAMMGSALVVAVDGPSQNAVTARPEPVYLARHEVSPASKRSDRLGIRPQKVASRALVHQTLIHVEGERELVEAHPYFLVKASLPTERRARVALLPQFDPIEIFAALGKLETDHDFSPETAEEYIQISYAPLDPLGSLADTHVPLDAAAVEAFLQREFGVANGESTQGAPMHAAYPEPAPMLSSLEFGRALSPLAVQRLDDASTSTTWIAKQRQPTPKERTEIGDGGAEHLRDQEQFRLSEVAVAQLDEAFEPPDNSSTQLGYVSAFTAPGQLRSSIGGVRGQQLSVYEALYKAGLRLDVPKELIDRIVQTLAFDVDFRRMASPGDSFEVFYSEEFEEYPGFHDGPEILYAAVTVRGVTRSFYRFRTPDDGAVDYYDDGGRSLQTFLIPQPMSVGTLRSGFGMRRHPTLGYSRMHNGADWAAPRGTPIVAAGPGRVIEARYMGTLGNHVRIRHPNGYETSYSHMSGFGEAVEPGARVRQGQVIGYVGSTGLSTGSHLHYEIIVDGQNIDPMRVRPLEQRRLDGSVLAAFRKEASRIDALMRQARPLARTAAR